MTKLSWRTKSTNNWGSIQEASSPGKCVSVDQIYSSTPGSIAQLKGKPTKQRYRAATIFLNHHSDLTYMHLQRGFSSEDTIEARKVFESYSRMYRVIIKHYHAYNGRFADNAFQQSLTQEGQTITYCGVNAHFQNGKAETRIRDIQEQKRKQLHHTKLRWPIAI